MFQERTIFNYLKKKDVFGNQFLWQPIKWLQYKKPVGEILFKTTFSENPFAAVSLKKRSKSNIDTYVIETVSKEAF